MKKVNYKIVRSKKELADVISLLYRYGKFSVDFETTSLDTHSEDIKVVGLGFCVKPREAFYVPFLDKEAEFDHDYIFSQVKIPVEDPDLPKIGQNIKYDYRVFSRFGIKLKNILMDTMVAHYCLFSDKYGHALDEMVLNHLGHIKIRTKSVIPGKKKGLISPTMADSPVETVAVYCSEDVDYTFRLYEYYTFLFSLPEFAYAAQLFKNIEAPLTPILAEMESTGVHIDTSVLFELREELIASINTLKQEINKVAETEITLTNPGQISELLYNKLQLFKNIKVKPTKTGKLSTTEKTLSLVKNHPVVGNILQVKKLNKLISTYIEPIPEKISTYDNKLHASFNQHVTNTGRLACLVGDTKVQLSDGSFCTIEHIHRKDIQNVPLRVKTHTGKDQIIDYSYDNGIQEVFELTTESGRKIQATKLHKFLTSDGWKTLEELSEGDSIYESAECN